MFIVTQEMLSLLLLFTSCSSDALQLPVHPSGVIDLINNLSLVGHHSNMLSWDNFSALLPGCQPPWDSYSEQPRCLHILIPSTNHYLSRKLWGGMSTARHFTPSTSMSLEYKLVDGSNQDLHTQKFVKSSPPKQKLPIYEKHYQASVWYCAMVYWPEMVLIIYN